ncbi:MAG TPA: VanW family protein [Candidatus Limnocylindrales bacterium]|nr:VanW family protein [Candidatus Limnocylindrales bacterium]
MTDTLTPAESVGTEALPVAAPPRPSHRGRRIAAAVALVLLPVLLVAGAAGGLLAWDAGYEGRILPGVHVGTADLSGLDRAGAAAAIAAAYPYADGRVILRTPDGDIAIAYADIGRRPDIDAMVDQAMASGRAGTTAERAVAEIRQALDGAVIAPRAVFDETALAAGVTDAVASLVEAPVDATITMTATGPVTTTARAGRTVDPAPFVAAAIAGVTGADAPAEVVVDVTTTAMAPAIDDEAVSIARIRVVRLVGDVKVTWGKKAWTIKADTVRGWVHFEVRPDGSVVPVAAVTSVEASLAKAAKAVARDPVNATFLKTRRGKIVGVVASHDGRALDTGATLARIAAELEARSNGNPGAAVAVATASVVPKLTTAEARKTAPLMVKLGGWTTYFPISERNYFGANIWRPAQIINGTVLAPGQTFDWWDAIWPVTPARGFGPGGIIRSDYTDPTGALGGGMCSSSTTLFNAALRAGLKMGQRSNHRYYIDRYPLGLDATVSVIGNSRQSMTFTNDTGHPIVIRAFKIRGAGGRGYVRYQIWGIRDGRKVELSRPSVSNLRRATTQVVTVTTLRHGVRKQTEYPSNGMDVSVVRIVRNARGTIIHREVWRTHYLLWNGRIEVGA